MAPLKFSFLYVLSPLSAVEGDGSWRVISSRFEPDGSVPGLPIGFELSVPPDQLLLGEPVPLMQNSFLEIPLPAPKESPFPFTYRGWATASEAAEPVLVLLTATRSIPAGLNGPLASLFSPEPVPDTLTVLLSSQNTMGVTPLVCSTGPQGL